MLEQSDTPSEQDGHQVDMYLVKQSGLDALLHDASGSYGDVLVARDRFRLFDGTCFSGRSGALAIACCALRSATTLR